MMDRRHLRRLALTLLLLPAMAGACTSGPPAPTPGPPPDGPEADTAAAPADTIVVAGPGAADTLTPDTLAPDTAAVDTAAGPAVAELPWPEATLQALTLRERVGQMIMPLIMGDFSPAGSGSMSRARSYVEDEAVGGLIVSVGTPVDVAVKLNQLQRRARVPLLVGADLETGAGFRLHGAYHLFSGVVLGGATDFPPLMALGAADEPYLAYDMGRVTALEARAVGIHLPFAPVLDVNNDPRNPIINVRSFGEDPERVALLGAAFVRGMQDNGVIAVGKHFPGHGDTGVDSHTRLPSLQVDRGRLERVELRPFREAVDAGMRGIMTAHIDVPALSLQRGVPATLSPEVMRGLLREEMGFDGLLITDAMDMGAVTRTFGRGEAAVRAIEAGADVLLMPPDVSGAIDAITTAVAAGRITRERIDRSVLHILRLKEEFGLDRDPFVDPEGVSEVVGVPEHLAAARQVAERSLTLLRDRSELIPLRGTRSAQVLSVSYRPSRHLLAGRYFDGELRSTYPRLSSVAIDRDSGGDVFQGLARAAARSDLVVISVYTGHGGQVTLSDRFTDFVRDVVRSGRPHVLLSFGNPYIVQDLPDPATYLLAWSGTEWSQRAAAEALVGRLPIRGRSPIRIPPYFEIGDGIRVPLPGGSAP